MNHKDLGLKAGLEIHFQLDTKHKLFCGCSTEMKEKKHIMTIKRKLHPVASELGKVDIAAQYEYLRDRVFYYQVFKNETCLVELDEEPPHPMNREALKIALQIALMLHCHIPEEIHIMRKTVIDGSNPSGFQRTAIVGFDGYFKFKGEKIPISQVTLEEDAAAKVKEEGKNVIYRLNRLGIPLVEIDTGILENFTPKEIQEIAYTIGLIAKSTGKIKRGVGTIRQDVNISIRRGARVEIKGVQELGLISKVIEKEIERQMNLIKKGEKVKEETRAAKQDGTTKFLRPLPGSNRMYPETDVPPIIVSRKLLRELKRKMPEPLTEKIERFKRNYKLSDLLANEIVKSEWLETFERIVKEIRVQPSLVASVFTSLLKDLKRRENLDIEKLREEHFYQIFSYLEKRKIVKEAIPEILKFLVKNPEAKLDEIIFKLNLKPLHKDKLKEIVREVKKKNPELPKEKIFGIVMGKVRGRASVEDVKRIFKNLK